MWTQIIQSAIKPIANIFVKRTERKTAKDSLKSKAVLQKQSDETAITLTDAGWDVVNAAQQTETWKDEYVTLVMTSPIILIIVGALVAGFGFGSEMIDSAIAGITALNSVGVPMGNMMSATVLAALGLKIWRS